MPMPKHAMPCCAMPYTVKETILYTMHDSCGTYTLAFVFTLLIAK